MHRISFLQLLWHYNSYTQRTKFLQSSTAVQDSLHKTYQSLLKVWVKSCLKDLAFCKWARLVNNIMELERTFVSGVKVSYCLIYFWVRKIGFAFAKTFNFIWEATFKTHHLATCSAIPLTLFPHPLLVAWCVPYPLGQLISWMHGCSRRSSEPANKSCRTTLDPIRDIFVLWFAFCRKHYVLLKG